MSQPVKQSAKSLSTSNTDMLSMAATARVMANEAYMEDESPKTPQRIFGDIMEIKTPPLPAEHIVSKELLGFLEDWYTWATTTKDGSGHDYFAPYDGLCGSLFCWCHSRHAPAEAIHLYLDEEMSDAFSMCGLSRSYPFGVENYRSRYHDDTQYQCPIRLEWVKKTIEKTKNIERLK